MKRERLLVAVFSSVALAAATSGAGVAIASTSHGVAVGSAHHVAKAPALRSAATDVNASHARSTSPTYLTRSQAEAAVLAKAPGTVIHTQSAKRGGYKAFAVTVRTADGSTVTGYVDKSSGVIFDWTQTAAPVAVTVSGPSTSHSGSSSSQAAEDQNDDDQYESDQNDDDQYESDENDDDQYESDNEDNDSQGSDSETDD